MELARVPLADLVRGALAGDLHNNCLVAAVRRCRGARRGRPRRAAPRRRALAGPPLHLLTRPRTGQAPGRRRPVLTRAGTDRC